jgi:hypothetical protein
MVQSGMSKDKESKKGKKFSFQSICRIEFKLVSIHMEASTEFIPTTFFSKGKGNIGSF